MLIFYEGLPRSGKSLNVIKDYVVPSLKKGRPVQAYIEGLNHDKIAELAEISIEDCHSLLTQLTAEDIPEIYNHVKKDSLVVIDELQDFFPSGREKLKPEIIKFITQHGHDGLDIVCMGQNLNDCHNMWRRRMAQKVYFFKREAIGKPDEYVLTVFKPVAQGDNKDLKWQETHKSTHKYDENYFGAYKSHTDGTTNKDTFNDERANIWNNPIIRKWLPLFAIVVVIAFAYAWHLFMGGGLLKVSHADEKTTNPTTTSQTNPIPQSAAQPTIGSDQSEKPKPAPPEQIVGKSPVDFNAPLIPDDPLDMVDDLSTKQRIRLLGTMKMGNLQKGMIEWRNDSYALVERLTFDQLKGMGWMVMINDDMTMVYLQKYHRRYIATMWPLPDYSGVQTQASKDAMKPPAGSDQGFTPTYIAPNS